MAESKPVSYEFSALERQWVVKSLTLQRQALIRSRGNEVVGSEIHVLRSKEIESLTALIARLGG